MGRKKILFASSGNPAITKMAGAIATWIFPAGVAVVSADTMLGTHPDPLVTTVLNEMGITSGLQLEKLEAAMMVGFRHLVSLGCNVLDHESPFYITSKLHVQEWAFVDPQEKDIGLYRQIRDKIAWRIKAYKAGCKR